MKAYSLTNTGLVRKVNEDTILMEGGAHGLYILADGMGGHKGGDVASALAARTLARMLADKTPSREDMTQAFHAANAAVYDMQQTDEKLTGMGTTLTALWEGEEAVCIGHVGDSRAYLYRDGKLHQLTDDHSMVGEMLRAGALTQEQAQRHPMRNIITRAVGTEKTLRPDVFDTIKMPGDLWLLCSDGLTDMTSDDDIAQVLQASAPAEACAFLVSLALMNGGRDNVSVLLLEVAS